jgi:hypothetical protein
MIKKVCKISHVCVKEGFFQGIGEVPGRSLALRLAFDAKTAQGGMV